MGTDKRKKKDLSAPERPARNIWLCARCGSRIVLGAGEAPTRCGECGSKRDWIEAPLIVIK